MGTQGIQMKGVFPWLVRWAPCAGKKDFCPALVDAVSPVENMFFLTVQYFSSFVPLPSKLGRQSCWVTCLLICVSGRNQWLCRKK
jgi:hypothetical protein